MFADIIELIKKPWPWYVAGPLIGLTVPILLILGNKSFGISATFRHICAACMPARIPFFQYEWKKEIWNLVFAAGIVVGAYIAFFLLSDRQPAAVDEKLIAELSQYGISDYHGMVPSELFNWNQLFSVKGLIITVGGGLLIGFGTRYAGGCTSGHSIMGLSTLQRPSLVATICFMAGGFFVSNIILPYILKM